MERVVNIKLVNTNSLGNIKMVKSLYGNIDQFCINGSIEELGEFLIELKRKVQKECKIDIDLIIRGSELIQYTGGSIDKELLNFIELNNDVIISKLAKSKKLNSSTFLFNITGKTGISLGYIFAKGDFSKSVPRDFRIMCEHIEGAIRHLHKRYVKDKIENLWHDLAIHSSSPEGSFTQLLKTILPAMSYFCPIEINRLSVFQLLSCQSESEQFRIRATSGNEPVNTIIFYSESVCGKSLKEKNGFLYIDPSDDDWKEIYLNYNTRGLKTRSELVVQIKDKHGIAAVLNLESENANEFNLLEIQYLLNNINLIAPFIRVLENKWKLLYDSPKSTVEATTQYLEAYAKALSHDYRAPILTLDYKIDGFSKQIPDKNGKTKTIKIRDLNEAKTAFHKLKTVVDGHVDSLRRVGESQRTSLRSLISEVIRDFKLFYKNDEQSIGDIKFVNAIPREIYIDVNYLIRAYIFQLTENSRRSINEKKCNKTDKWNGIIRFHYKHFIINNNLYDEHYALLKIRDNGVGVSISDLNRLKLFNPGTRIREDEGEGNALVATHRHMKHNGGWLDIDSRKNVFFEATLGFKRTALGD